MGSRSCYRYLADVVFMAAACRSLGSQLTSALGRRRSPKSRSGRDGGTRRDPNHCAFLKGFSPNRAEEALLGQGELLWGSFGLLEVLEVRGACSRREVVAWSGGNVKGSTVFVFFMKCGTIEVYVVFLDTLTPMFELYVRVLRPETLEVPGMDLQLCVCRCGVARYGVPCYGTGLLVVSVLVVWCDLPLIVFSPFSAFDVVWFGVLRASFWLAVLLPTYLRLACEAYSLGVTVDERTSGVSSFFLPSKGELLWGSFGRLEVLEVRGECSCREVVAWSGGNAEGSLVFAFFVKCGIVEVCVDFLDTLTPVFELVLRPETLEMPGMDLQLCVCRCGVARYGVPCYGTGLLVVSVLVPCGSGYLYPVWVMVCGAFDVVWFGVLRASFWLAVLLPTYLRLSCEAYSLGVTVDERTSGVSSFFLPSKVMFD
ncbi:hypothetical protein Taro_031615 [Colocasia esculenta]|uniref:Uncharacterized protein n=1 Tax=Colocasia esculenta TaxID=4460 RepID=A0A843VJ95_COLES|nr:hypothetical protein [Colocasia esculenta]